MSLKVINLGLPKSGTTTLARALRLAGLKVIDHRVRNKQTDNRDLHGAYVADLLYRGFFETGNPAALLDGFQAVSETSLLRKGRSIWPQTDAALIRALKRENPGLKFLASRRDSFAMSQSMLAWSDLGLARLPAHDVPGLPSGFGTTSRERMLWIDGHYVTLQQMFENSDDFLEYDVADPEAPKQIGAFLGLDLPWWGKANANPERNRKEVV